MTDILQKIATYKREEVAAAKAERPAAFYEGMAAQALEPRGFCDAIEACIAQGSPALIGEIKRASPSRGLIREDFDPQSLAQAYAGGGATCLSVLTDEPSFQGRLLFLEDVRASCRLPVLRKDFLLDPYQVAESRAWGADCILVIMAMVDDGMAETLVTEAMRFDMDVLVEVHDELELARALNLPARLIGINNRDLKTFVTDLATTERLAPLVPDDRIVVAESGLATPDDLARLSAVGVNTFLIGESLMRHRDVEAATRAILAPATAGEDMSSPQEVNHDR